MSSTNTVTSAVLIKVKTGMVGKTLTDREITNEVRTAKVMQGDDTGRWVKNKWGKSALKAMTGAVSEAYQWHREHTIPWDDWGYGLVRADMLDAYRDGFAKIEATFQWRRVLSLEPDDKQKAEAEAKLKNGLGPATAPIAKSTVANN